MPGVLVEDERWLMDGRPAARYFGHFGFSVVSHGGRDQQEGTKADPGPRRWRSNPKWSTPRQSAGDGTDYGLNVIHGKRTIGALPVNWDNFLLY